MPDTEAKSKPSKAVVVIKDAVTLQPIKGYRTFAIAFLSILGGVLNLVNWNDFFNDWKAGVTAIIMGVAMGFMRIWTNSPPGSNVPYTKEPEVQITK